MIHPLPAPNSTIILSLELKGFINNLEKIPMIGQSRGDERVLGHRELQELGYLIFNRDGEDEVWLQNLSDKNIVAINTREHTVGKTYPPKSKEMY